MTNILSSDANGLTYLDDPISENDPTTPRQVILSLYSLTDETKDKKVFITVEKDYRGNFKLFYKKKFHWDTSTIAEYLGAVMSK